MAKSETESFIKMVHAAYRMRITAAKTEQEKAALAQERDRVLKKASQGISSVRWYHMAELGGHGAFWNFIGRQLNLGSVTLEALRGKLTGLTTAPDSIDRSVEPTLSTPVDTTKVAEAVLGAFVPNVPDNGTSPTPAQNEIARRASFTFNYGPQREKVATVEGFASFEALIEAVANGQRSRQLAEVLHRLRPQSGDNEVASVTFAARLLERVGERLLQPMTNAQFLNLQIFMVVGIKQVRPEIDPEDKYDRFAEEIGARLKEQARAAHQAEPLTLADMGNIAPITSGTPTREARNRDLLRRTGIETEQPSGQVVSMLLEAMRLGLVAPAPTSPDRLAQLARQIANPDEPKQ